MPILPFDPIDRRVLRELHTIETTNPARYALLVRLIDTLARPPARRATDHPPLKVERRAIVRAAR